MKKGVPRSCFPLRFVLASVTRLAHETVGVHAPFEHHGRVPHVVRRHQPVAVVHAGRVYGVPADRAQSRAGLALEPQLHHRLVHVVLVPAKRTVGIGRGISGPTFPNRVFSEFGPTRSVVCSLTSPVY